MSNTHKAVFTATKILLPIDFSPSSQPTLEAAAGLAEQFHASVHLVHIIPETPDWNGSDFFPDTAVLQERREIIEEKLEARKEQLLLKGVPTSLSIETGNDIVGTLIRVIKREHADMVVISTHGMSGWHPLIFGSIAEQLVKQVDCTLLLLRSSQHVSAGKEPAIQVWEDCFVPHTMQTASVPSTVPGAESLAQARMDRVADDLAQQGGRTEQRYDLAHPIFSK